MQIHAPAKINLFLAVRGTRQDGYRDLETVIQAVGLYDTIDVSPAKELVCTCSDPSVPVDEENLVMRAAGLLLREDGRGRGAAIHLEKKIPVAGGMGGGSSDAAAVLTALNHLWEMGRSRERLSRLAARLGSDVPFFLEGGAALCTGRGEIVEPLESAARFWVVLVNPRTGLSTKDVYAELGEKVTAGEIEPGTVIDGLRKGDTGTIAAGMHNELESAAFRLLPPLRGIRESLRKAGCSEAMVSGSGPTLFGLAETEAAAREIASGLRMEYPEYFVEAAAAL
jgi:4-diphosphocytidyl-2-C-methyl-D-erythritol kinase